MFTDFVSEMLREMCFLWWKPVSTIPEDQE